MEPSGVTGRWLTNTYDPSRPDWPNTVICRFDQTREEATASLRAYLQDKIIGEPKETPTYSVAALKAMGIVGVYARPEARHGA